MALGSQEAMEVNLIFVAAADDDIWSALKSVSLLSDDPNANEVAIGADQLTVAEGDTRSEGTLGNVKFSFPLPPLEGNSSYSFSRVALTLEGAAEPAIVDVGSWRAERRPDDTLIETAGESVIAAPVCGTMTTKVRNLSDTNLLVEGMETSAPGVRFEDVVTSGLLTPGGVGDISFDVTCDDSADFQIVTPRLTLSEEGETREAFLDTISIGLTGITTETINRILSR